MAIYKSNMEKKLKDSTAKTGDMSDERLKQLIHADKMVRLGALSAGIAHEINNPTGFIRSNLQIFEAIWNKSIKTCIEKAIEQNENKDLSFALNEMPRMVKTMIEGTNRISTLIRRLSDFSIIKECVLMEVDICDCIKNAIAFCKFDLSMKYMVDIQANLPDDMPNLMINKQEIEQVFINVLANAVHALEGIKDNRKLTLKISAAQEKNSIVVNISDNGCGMDKMDLESIFNPFFSIKKHVKGTGLGLYICHEIIKKHEGTITVKSTLTEGTTFRITLPINRDMEVINNP